MLAFIVSRLLQSLAVMLAVSFLCFVLFNFVGDPVNNMVGQEATASDREEMRRDLGLEDSVAVQFVRFAFTPSQVATFRSGDGDLYGVDHIGKIMRVIGSNGGQKPHARQHDQFGVVPHFLFPSSFDPASRPGSAPQYGF